METLAGKFLALKQKVGGNREKQGFEFTFGARPEEIGHVTRPSAAIERILSQVDYAIKLSAVYENRFDREIDAALNVLEEAMAKDGVLTHGACEGAERRLMPLQGAAKEYELIYAAHAHIDMNWMWGLQETVAATLATFRTMLKLMEQYPEFTYMQSQGAVYKIVEKYDPQLMEAIKARIREGRWEVTASAWVETDKNMPDAESLLHHISVTRSYLHEVWGVDPDSVKVDFSPDTFGHSRFIPEINRFGGIKYYYHCRGLKELYGLYRYRAPSGAEVLAYREPYWYNSGVNPDNGTGLIELTERMGGLKTGLIVYGVGDHGGGPTRRDIERVLEMAKWPIFPAIRFGTLHAFFEKAEAVYDRLNVVDHELNMLFSGCYTTQSRIKLGNRRSETALRDAEMMCALGSKVADIEYPADRFTQAWQDVLFTHFHDILTGSCVQETREHAMGMFAEALSYAQTAESNALRVLSEAVDTSMFTTDEDLSETQSEGAGAGFGLDSYAGVPNPERGAGRTRVYTVFNTASTDREDTVTLTMWDYVGDLKRLEVVDKDGAALPFELLDREPQKYWDHRYVRLLVLLAVPAVGYTVLAVREKPVTAYPTYYLDDERVEKVHGPVILENRYLRAEFASDHGALLSLIDKETGLEQLSGPARLHCVLAEKRTNSAWNIGRHLKSFPVEETVTLTPNHGALRSGVEIMQKVLSSTVKTTVSLDQYARELHYSFEVDWNEAAGHGDRVPVLIFSAPVAGHPDAVLCDVPAGCMLREAQQIDVPGLSFAMAQGGTVSPAILTDCKYGYRLFDGVLSCTLINSSLSPDPYPERGIHKIQLWLRGTKGDALQMKRRSEALMRPLVAMPTMAKCGELAPEGSLMNFNSAGSALSSVSLEEDGSLKVRAFELLGQPDHVEITLPFAPKSAMRQGDGNVEVEGNRVRFDVEPYRLAEIRIEG